MRAKSLGALAVLAAMLSACGGSSDDGAGSPTPFSVSPSTLTIEEATCHQGYAGDFVVSGGTPPYRIYVSNTDALQLNVNTLSSRNGIFQVFFTNGWCFDPATVSVFDAQDNRVAVTLINKIKQ